MSALHGGSDDAIRLIRAILGPAFDGSLVRRLVLDINVKDVVTAYVELYPQRQHMDGAAVAAAEAMADRPQVVPCEEIHLEPDGAGGLRIRQVPPAVSQLGASLAALYEIGHDLIGKKVTVPSIPGNVFTVVETYTRAERDRVELWLDLMARGGGRIARMADQCFEHVEGKPDAPP